MQGAAAFADQFLELRQILSSQGHQASEVHNSACKLMRVLLSFPLLGRLRRSSPSWPASIATGPNFCSTQRASCSPHLCLMQLQCTERWRSCYFYWTGTPLFIRDTPKQPEIQTPAHAVFGRFARGAELGGGHFWLQPQLVQFASQPVRLAALYSGTADIPRGWQFATTWFQGWIAFYHQAVVAQHQQLGGGVDPPTWSGFAKIELAGGQMDGFSFALSKDGVFVFFVAAILRVPFTSRVLLQDLPVENRAWLLRLLDPSMLAEKTPTEKINMLRADLRFLRQKTVAWCLRSGVVDQKLCRLVVEDPGAPCWLYMVLPNFDCCGFISWVLWFSLAATHDDYDLVLEKLYCIRFRCDGKWKKHHRFFWSWWHGAGQ